MPVCRIAISLSAAGNGCCLENLLLVRLNPAVEVVAVQVDAASLAHHHDFLLVDQMLERLLRSPDGPVATVPAGKIRVTIRLDEGVLDWFRTEVDKAGGGNYQSLINLALRDFVSRSREPLESTLRRVIREELKSSAQDSPKMRQIQRDGTAQGFRNPVVYLRRLAAHIIRTWPEARQVGRRSCGHRRKREEEPRRPLYCRLCPRQ